MDKEDKMSKNNIILCAMILTWVSLMLIGKTNYASAIEEENKICKGAFIDEVDVGGMTADEAQTAVDNFTEKLSKKDVIIKVGDNDVKVSLEKLGFSYVANDNINQALMIGRAGNLIKRYKELKDIEHDKVVYPMDFLLSDKKLDEVISVDTSEYNVKPINASVSRKNDQFNYTDEKAGTKVNIDKTVELIKSKLSDSWNRENITVEAVVDEDKPKYTKEMAKKCDTLLGSFYTTYESSSSARANNLANGAKLINNTVIYPGEIFSAHDALVPFTIENGYEVAGAYLNGEVVDSVGGGACQVSTTLYNAVLFAELEVVERAAHSMTVSYVERSRDAALAGEYKDFKFKNSTDAPILIEGITYGRKITFNIWGDENRDTQNRKIEFVSKDTGHTSAPAKPIIKKDSSRTTDYRHVDQHAHNGYTSELYKVVYENGVEVSRTRVNKSTYKAEAEHVTVGTKKIKEPLEDAETDKNNKDTKDDESPDDESPDDESPDDESSEDDDWLDFLDEDVN
jgi:vancomycin resistance protein YoaR